MDLAALVSGGKDSLYAAYLVSKKNDIKYIISFISDNPESYMFHVPNVHLVAEQAKVMDVRFLEKRTKGIKEEELDDMKSILKLIADEIDGVVCGAIASNYQKSRLEKICQELHLGLDAPLWHKDQEGLMRDMLKNDFRTIITAVAAPPLDESWLGRMIDEKCLKELIELNKRYGISVSGEGGELETFVLNCPLFSKKIRIMSSQKHWNPHTKSGWLEIRKTTLVIKT